MEGLDSVFFFAGFLLDLQTTNFEMPWFVREEKIKNIGYVQYVIFII